VLIVPIALCARPIGTISTIGTAPKIGVDERTAIAPEGGVPALSAPAFAKMQVRMGSQIPNRSEYEHAADDAGRLLDAWGMKAERLG
jgi:hypothetical protein